MPKLLRCVVLVLAGLLGTGCAASQKAQPSDDSATQLRVENRSGQLMTIYVLRESQRVRLGQVSGYSDAAFTIPGHLVRGLASLRFLADPLAGSRTPVSHEIIVEPGDTVELYIPPY